MSALGSSILPEVDACRRCKRSCSTSRRLRRWPSRAIFVIRFGAIGTVVTTVLFGWWVSLWPTSEPLDADRRAIVDGAITLLVERGFTRQALVLRHGVASGHLGWWNLCEHHQAHAATNFRSRSSRCIRGSSSCSRDVEHAVVLLHEAHPEGPTKRPRSAVWLEKSRLAGPRTLRRRQVWKNTREWTGNAPDAFVLEDAVAATLTPDGGRANLARHSATTRRSCGGSARRPPRSARTRLRRRRSADSFRWECGRRPFAGAAYGSDRTLTS